VTEQSAARPRPSGFVCPLPLRHHDRIVLGHGGGGRLSADLIEHLILPAYGEAAVSAGERDSALIEPPRGRLAFCTDAFVVRPMFFPGGDIGELAVNGTINDLAMSGAQPLVLAVSLVLEEGLELETLHEIAQSIGRAATRAGVRIVTGDTKVVERGHGDGCFVTTSGIGAIPDGLVLDPSAARPGDVILISGAIGCHGVAVLSVREGLQFATALGSDTAPLNGLVGAMCASSAAIRVLRDPTRGGVAATLNELARSSGVGMRIEEAALPVPPAVAAACDLFGLDPLQVANEGKLVAVVAREDADALLEVMRRHPLGAEAALIGEVTSEHPGLVISHNAFGGTRVIDRPYGEQLPRIC
jgi:hydrogenase expression/formation protein HypE